MGKVKALAAVLAITLVRASPAMADTAIVGNVTAQSGFFGGAVFGDGFFDQGGSQNAARAGQLDRPEHGARGTGNTRPPLGAAKPQSPK